MSAAARTTKARKSTPPKPETEILPLAGVSITVTKPKLYSTDTETVTFDGARLAAALRYIALTSPSLDLFTDATYTAIELDGIAKTCSILGEGDYEVHGEPAAVFHALYRRLDDLASRINAGHVIGAADSITITRKSATASSSTTGPDAAQKIAAYDRAQAIVDAVKKAGRKGKVA
jgi:hypothetical protein